MKTEWIDVKDRLPELKESVILYSEYDGRCIGYRVTDSPPFSYGEPQAWDRDYMIMGYNAEIRSGITHWMPLPEPPKTATT